MLINTNSIFLNTRNKSCENLTYLTLTIFPLGLFLQVDKKYPSPEEIGLRIKLQSYHISYFYPSYSNTASKDAAAPKNNIFFKSHFFLKSQFIIYRDLYVITNHTSYFYQSYSDTASKDAAAPEARTI